MVRVAVIDDESGQVDIMKDIIQDLYPQVEVVPFTSALEALNYLLTHPADGVLTDIRMPKLDGLELAQRLHAQRPDVAVAIISAHSDFSYAQRALEYGVTSYMLKPISRANLSEVMDKLFDQIKQARLKRDNMRQLEDLRPLYVDAQVRGWLGGTLAQAKCREMEALFDAHPSGFVAVTKCHLDGPAPDWQQLRMGARALLKSLLPAAQVLSVGLEDAPIWVNVVCAPIASEGALHETLDMFCARLRQAQAMVAHVGYAAAAQHFAASAPRCFRQAMEASGHILLPDCQPCLAHSALDGRQSIDDAGLRLMEQRLLMCLRQADLAGCGQLLQAFLQDVSARRLDFTMKRLREFFARVIFLAKNQSGAWLDAEHTIAQTVSCQYLDQLCALALDTFGAILQARQDQDAGMGVKPIMDYIHNNCEKDLSLEHLAQVFHFNPTYLSGLFKAQAKVGMKEYVIQTRIERAQALLKTTHRKVYQIAQDVGYPDPAYFIRLFKRQTGLSPNQYRALHRS